jgi:hypothetical protein
VRRPWVADPYARQLTGVPTPAGVLASRLRVRWAPWSHRRGSPVGTRLRGLWFVPNYDGSGTSGIQDTRRIGIMALAGPFGRSPRVPPVDRSMRRRRGGGNRPHTEQAAGGHPSDRRATLPQVQPETTIRRGSPSGGWFLRGRCRESRLEAGTYEHDGLSVPHANEHDRQKERGCGHGNNHGRRQRE